MKMSEHISTKQKIKILAMDVDGTLTDGKLYIGNTGEQFKCFHVHDGSGIYNLLPQYGIKPAVITARKSEIVNNRCRELGITLIYQNCKDKTAALEQLADEHGFKKVNDVFEQIAYIGDDIIDLAAMEVSGVTGCPANSTAAVQKCADYVCQKNGGEGAVREFIEWLIAERDAEK